MFDVERYTPSCAAGESDAVAAGEGPRALDRGVDERFNTSSIALAEEESGERSAQ